MELIKITPANISITRAKLQYEIERVERKLSRANDKRLRQETLQFNKKISELKKISKAELNQEKKIHRNDLMLLKKSFKEQIRKNRDNFAREIETLRGQIGCYQYPYVPYSYLGQTGITNIAENQIINPQSDFLGGNPTKNYDPGESIHQSTPGDLEARLSSLKQEIISELEKRANNHITSKPDNQLDPNSASKLSKMEKELQQKDSEIEQLRDQIQKLQKFTSSNPGLDLESSAAAESTLFTEEDDHDTLQQNILDMVKEIAQEKRGQVTEINEGGSWQVTEMDEEVDVVEKPKLSSFGEKLAKKFGLVNGLF